VCFRSSAEGCNAMMAFPATIIRRSPKCRTKNWINRNCRNAKCRHHKSANPDLS
jgi:hypothetical protein